MPEIQPLRVGVLGCGNIAKQYFKAAKRFEYLEVVACADLRREAAEAAAEEFGVPNVRDVDGLLAADDTDCILNLTIPAAPRGDGAEGDRAAKHVYGEKPLGIDRSEGAKLIADAEAAGSGSAPRPTPSWAPASRPRAERSTTGSSASRCTSRHG